MTADHASSSTLTKSRAASITLGVVVLVIVFLLIAEVLGLAPVYAGFLLLWYFGSIDELDTKALPALAIGALAGTSTAWLLQVGVAQAGVVGAVPAVIVIIGAIFCQLLGLLPIAINRAYMLYVTVLAASLLQQHEQFDRVMLTIVVATLYFGGVVMLGSLAIAKRRAVAV